jgi:hypothetical protein
MNGNTFLTYARTITFLIQKDKEKIPNFNAWYQKHVIESWKNEPIMTWAKEARNSIEKEGDFEHYSELNVSLIFDNLEESDIIIKQNKENIIKANIDKLLKFAELSLPKWISEDAVIKIERRWVATSLPDVELLQAFVFIFAQHHRVCSALADHLGAKLDKDIHNPGDFDNSIAGSKRITYIKYADRRIAHFKSIRQHRDPKFIIPVELESSMEEIKAQGQPQTLAELVNLQAIIAKSIFEHQGSYLPTLMLFDEQFSAIDQSSVMLDDRATKFMFWRMAADKIAYLGASSIIWISEYWNRKGDFSSNPAWKEFPITGEGLCVIGLDKHGELIEKTWDIARNSEGVPTLISSDRTISGRDGVPFFLNSAMNAFRRTERMSRKDID